jgi:hypothetical protein
VGVPFLYGKPAGFFKQKQVVVVDLAGAESVLSGQALIAFINSAGFSAGVGDCGNQVVAVKGLFPIAAGRS